MKAAAIVEQIGTVAVQEWRAASKFFGAVVDFAASAPSNVWAMCAFTAAASIMVTLVTFYLWPKDESTPTPLPKRERDGESSGANGVWRLASRGLGAQDIARKTGMSHDAVATILRARTPSRSVPAIDPRKSRPSAA